MKRFLVIFFLLVFVIGYSSDYAFPLQSEAGFMEIEPIHFYFHFNSYFNRLVLTSSVARLWYSFQPADEGGEEKPLFVFFNGGPGSGTSGGLMSFNTGPMTLDSSQEHGGDQYAANPISWTRLGNLLYIDARQAGFSYSLMELVHDTWARRREFAAQNHNCFFDAADFIRLLLRFLAEHPRLEKNPVIIVGESYGGVRTTVMLHILLNYRDYANGKEMYQDKALVQEIQVHYDKVFPDYKGSPVPPEIIASQFGQQILIQPLLCGQYQDEVTGEMFEQAGSVIYQIAEEEGMDYVPCKNQPDNPQCDPHDNAISFVDAAAKRDYYNYSQPRDWMWGYFFNAGQMVRHTQALSLLTDVDVINIAQFYASSRLNAYRLVDPNAEVDQFTDQLPLIEKLHLQAQSRFLARTKMVGPGDMSEVFGQLKDWDRFFMTNNRNALTAFYYNVATFRGYNIDPRSNLYGRMFLKNLVHVRTFITNAKYDLVIYSPAIPASLACYRDILESASHDTQPHPGEERPGRILLNYRSNAFPDIQNPGTRIIRFPLYAASCHAVSITEPVELFEDVSTWLKQGALRDSCMNKDVIDRGQRQR